MLNVIKNAANKRYFSCAGRENRTPVSSLARTCSTTKPYPQCYSLYAKTFFLQQTKKERIKTIGFHPPVTRLAHTPQRDARAINQIVRPPGLEPGLSVSKTEVISVSLRALISTYYLKIHKISKICYNITNERLK